ncbi:unnamed protein product [Durusdinium trenchii]|uniref:Uncharacterized protein n=1 Tax=Durusdinium trenchii TaxID=1381693 RepID=A0ABP0IRN2_9DINO
MTFKSAKATRTPPAYSFTKASRSAPVNRFPEHRHPGSLPAAPSVAELFHGGKADVGDPTYNTMSKTLARVDAETLNRDMKRCLGEMKELMRLSRMLEESQPAGSRRPSSAPAGARHRRSETTRRSEVRRCCQQAEKSSSLSRSAALGGQSDHPGSTSRPFLHCPHTPWDLDAAQRKQMVDDFNDTRALYHFLRQSNLG